MIGHTGRRKLHQHFGLDSIIKGIEIVFNDFGLHRIEANIMPENRRSLRVVEKLGFYNEGLSYKYLKVNGKVCPEDTVAKKGDDETGN